MIVTVVSPPGEVDGEAEVVQALCTAGLERYHLRKPGWEQARVADWLGRLPPSCCSRVVLHAHHALAERFRVGGVHFGDGDEPGDDRLGLPGGGLTSRSCHDPETLAARLSRYDSLFFGPVFASLSKPGYGPAPAHALDQVRALLSERDQSQRRARVLAIGGITPERLPTCSAMGFDGVAIVGAVWSTADPAAAFSKILLAARSHACAPPSAELAS
jgi:thiamine-phosphate pyrophosphorylase